MKIWNASIIGREQELNYLLGDILISAYFTPTKH